MKIKNTDSKWSALSPTRWFEFGEAGSPNRFFATGTAFVHVPRCTITSACDRPGNLAANRPAAQVRSKSGPDLQRLGVKPLHLFTIALGCVLSGVRAEPPAITPSQRIVLYHCTERNDLSAFYTWLGRFGRDSDPDRVFTLVEQIDGAPAIRVSGQYYGGIVTKSSYTNYRLILEYRWGLTTWADRKNKARDSGILFHLSGEDGNNNKNFRGAWTRSVEYQILEGGTGDIWLVNGWDRDRPDPTSPTMMIAVKPGTRVWDPAGTPTEFKLGRIAWRNVDPDWKPDLGFRGRNDVEKPVGQWNRIECICEGGDVTYFLNDVKVNEGKNGSFKEGRLLFQSEGAEIYFRRIELLPLAR